jgi:hypothetical protein
LRDALSVFLGQSGIDEILVTEDGSPVGVLSRRAMADVLRRKLAESELQDPTLHWPTTRLRRHLDRARHALASRVRRRRVPGTHETGSPVPPVQAEDE